MGLTQEENDQFSAIFAAMFKRAEQSMNENLHAALFNYGTVVCGEYVPPSRWKKLYWFIKDRALGVWNVLRCGECGNCTHDEY